MINSPQSLSRDGLTALSDAELAQKVSDAQETLNAMKERGEDTSVQEKVYQMYVDEYRHRTIADAPTQPSRLKKAK